MTTRPAISVSEFDPKRPLLAKPNYRPSSVNSSIRSSSSRITPMGYIAGLEPKIDVSYGTAYTIKDLSWFDHLLRVFCISRQPKLKTVQTTVSKKVPFDSPWVLPVYVLSPKRDEYRHFIPEEAKCTIDTGNLQGNIVSRAFLVDVLGYSEANFQKLTKKEEDGGTGITGHTLIPEGAINLTWYHSNSTRVFRDMRFLISEHPMYDLIIGAHSIREHNILDVPNLMGGPGGSGRTDSEAGPRRPLLDKLEKEQYDAQKALDSAAEKAYDDDDESSTTKARLALLTKTYETKKQEWVAELRRVYELEIQQPTKWTEQELRKLFKVKTGKEITEVPLPPPGHAHSE